MTSKSSKSTKKEQSAPELAADNATLANMLAELRADLLTKPDSLSVRFENKLASIDSKLDGLQITINDHEQRISDLESGLNQLQLLESQVTNMADDNAKLRARVTDLEGRSRRCNVRLIGIPVAAEGTRPTSFFSKLLVDLLGEDVLPAPPELDRAHRSLRPKPAEGGKPRPVIVCFHKFQTKDIVIRAARARRNELKYDGKPVYIYDDYCPEVMQQRAEYKDVMRQLFNLKLSPTLLYPARLFIRAGDGGKRRFFTVKEAEQFLASLQKSVNSGV